MSPAGCSGSVPQFTRLESRDNTTQPSSDLAGSTARLQPRGYREAWLGSTTAKVCPVCPGGAGRSPVLAGSSHALLLLTSPATKKSNGASSSLALYLAMIFSAMGWISCFAASDSPSSSESAGHSRGETKQKRGHKEEVRIKRMRTGQGAGSSIPSQHHGGNRSLNALRQLQSQAVV